MSLPTQSDLNTLKFSYNGQVHASSVGKISVVTEGLNWSYNGMPFVAAGAVSGGSGSGVRVQVFVVT